MTTRNADDSSRAASAHALAATLERDVEPLEIAANEATWEAERTGAAEAFDRVEALRARVMTRLSDRDEFRRAGELLESGGEEIAPELRRQVFRWRNRLAANQVDASTIARLARDEAELVRQYNGFRARLGDATVTDNEIDRILHEERSSAAVEAAWRASKAIARYTGEDGGSAPVAERLRALVRLRNDAARQIGFDNAYRAHLELGEMEQDWLYTTLDLLERETRPLFEAWKSGLDRELAQRFGVAVLGAAPLALSRSLLSTAAARGRSSRARPGARRQGHRGARDPQLRRPRVRHPPDRRAQRPVSRGPRDVAEMPARVLPLGRRAARRARAVQHHHRPTMDGHHAPRVRARDLRQLARSRAALRAARRPSYPVQRGDRAADGAPPARRPLARTGARARFRRGARIRDQRPAPPRDPPPGVHAVGAGDVPLRARALREPRPRRPGCSVVGPGRALPAGAAAVRRITATTTGRPRSTSWATRRTTRTT